MMERIDDHEDLFDDNFDEVRKGVKQGFAAGIFVMGGVSVAMTGHYWIGGILVIIGALALYDAWIDF